MTITSRAELIETRKRFFDPNGNVTHGQLENELENLFDWLSEDFHLVPKDLDIVSSSTLTNIKAGDVLRRGGE